MLRGQINALSPNRSKVSDGTIGDAAHASRASDHNPWVKDGKTGVVTGMDLTHDPDHGVDSHALALALVASRDDRIKYVIGNGMIASGSAGPQPWVWRKYSGKNPHNHHVHLSVKATKAAYDDAAPWTLGLTVAPAEAERPVIPPKNPLLVRGNKGVDVERLQRLLNKRGAALTPDADFGGRTETAVKAFQRKRGLVVDGRVGPQTWACLLYTSPSPRDS